MNRIVIHIALIVLILVKSTVLAMSSTNNVKRIFVTGANKGIGRAICERLLSEDNIYVLLGSRSRQRGEDTMNQIIQSNKDAKGRVEVVEIDVGNDASVKEAAEKVGKGGSLYGLVNNAGIAWGNGFEKTIETNYRGTKRTLEAFVPYLEKPNSRIVNIASASGPMFVSSLRISDHKKILADPLSSSLEEVESLADHYCGLTDYDNDAYGVSKALVNAYTALIAKEYKNKLIINSVTPGWILTDMTRGTGASNPPEKVLIQLFISC